MEKRKLVVLTGPTAVGKTKLSIELAKRLDIQPSEALKLFYESETCEKLHDKSTGLYLYGDLYVADEFMLEMQNKQ